MTNPTPGWDIPFLEQAPTDLPDFALAGAVLAGGLVIAGAMVPVPEHGPVPALVYRFTDDQRRTSAPIVLILDPIRMASVSRLTDAAVTAALRAARTHRHDGR